MRRLLVLPLTALLVCATAMSATASPTRPSEPRLFTPPPTPAAITQIEQLAKSGDWHDALLLAKMVTTPQAVWLTSGTPAQAQSQVRTTMAAAARQRAVPTFVAYDIPGRDCAQFSAGGALDEASYDAWIDGVAAGIGQRRAIVILEPDALGLLPSSCNLSTTVYPFTDTQRYAELNHAVTALAADRNVSLYLDGTHSAWQSVGTISQRLITAGVQRATGVFVDVSNYQPTPELIDYGTWISDCIAIVTDPANPLFNNPAACASQYFPATQSDFSTWDLTSQWYAQHLGTSKPTMHFVIDTSRNGTGPNAMAKFGAAPFNQPASVISKLAAGSWCNPPDSGLGLHPTTRTGTPLLDAYLWVKTPGQSDGQCDAAGGVRQWDYSAYTLPSWPTDPAAQQLFDPLWGTNDPAAGAWFPQQALQLAQDASPSLR